MSSTTVTKNSVVPPFEGMIEAYTKKYVHKHWWRLENHFSYEDLMQEAYCVYLKCLRRYEHVVDTPQWFMSLYQRSLTNRINDLSLEETALNQTVSTCMGDGESSFDFISELLPGDLENEAFTQILMEQAPEELKKVINFIDNAPQDLIQKVLDAWSTQGKKKSLGTTHLCMLLGISSDFDIKKAAHDYFLS